MDNSIVNVELSLKGEEYISELRKKVYEDELREINLKFPLYENEIDIKQSYIIKNDNNLEVGFFIRNGLIKNIAIEVVSLVVEDKQGNCVLSKVFNFKNYGTIPPLSAKPYVVNFEFNDNVNIIDGEEYTIKLDDANNYKLFSSVETKIDNMPLDISFDEEQEIRNYANNLETLKQDRIDISIYKLSYTKIQGIECSVIIRNGYNKDINFEKLPITILNEDGEVVARKLFESTDDSLKVSAKKSIFIKFIMFPDDVLDKNADLSKCRIECK